MDTTEINWSTPKKYGKYFGGFIFVNELSWDLPQTMTYIRIEKISILKKKNIISLHWEIHINTV